MNLLRGLFKRKTQPARQANHALAMVMLADAAPFDGAAALKYLASTWPDLPAVTESESKDGTVVAAHIPGGALGLAQMRVPIPNAHLLGPVAAAWQWPDGPERVAAHRSHIIVHAASHELDRIDLRLFHTKLVAAVSATVNAVGVYVGDAILVRSASDYRDEAADASRDNLPIMLWVGFNGVKEDEGMSAYTTGLLAFGLLEMEIRRSQRPLTELFGTLADLANYQLMSGSVLRDGDTFGVSADDRTRVRFASSAFIPGARVFVLDVQ